MAGFRDKQTGVQEVTAGMDLFVLTAVLAGALVFYTFAGYPLIIIAAARLRRKITVKSPWRGSVSIVLVVRNAEDSIRPRIENLLAQAGEWESFEILVGSDGSTDATETRLKEVSDPRVRPQIFSRHRGKTAVLNDLIPMCRGEIVIFADVRQRFELHTAAELCANFNNPEVGAVSGEFCFEDCAERSGIGEGLAVYWDIEKEVRKAESLVDSVIGCSGSVYAARKDCCTRLDPETVLDDVARPMLIAMQGRRVIFEPGARAWDRVENRSARESARKLRTLAGNIQLCALYPELLSPARNRLFFQFVSHKLLRLFAPWFMLVFLASTAWLGRAYPAAVALALLQAAFYGLGAAGLMLKKPTARLLRLPAAFVLLNLCAAAAPFKYWFGHLTPKWR